MSDSTDTFSLVQLPNGTFSVRSHAYAETMHPGVGPAAEASALYVEQIGLGERLARHSGDFVIWDVGLGAAANALTVLGQTRAIPSRIRLLSFDRTADSAQFALQHAAKLPYLAGFEAHLRALLEGGHVRIEEGPTTVDWTLHLGDFPAQLGSEAALGWPAPDLVLFDPFSPARNPAMWTLGMFRQLFARLDPARPCVLPSYSRSTMTRVTLLLAGFWVGRGRATGFKEETTVAANTPTLLPDLLDGRWLERARRSDSAEPLHEPSYRKAPLRPDTWQQLSRHPQFQTVPNLPPQPS